MKTNRLGFFLIEYNKKEAKSNLAVVSLVLNAKLITDTSPTVYAE